MISESRYWKEPLLDIAGGFEDLKRVEELSEAQVAQLERNIVIGFYSIRKLIESQGKVTDKSKRVSLILKNYPNLKEVTWNNRFDIDDNYDLSAGTKVSRDVLFVCGRIIHSYVFALSTETNNGLDVYFSSDYDKNTCLFSVSIDEIISLFRRIGSDYPTWIFYFIIANLTKKNSSPSSLIYKMCKYNVLMSA